MHVPCHCPTLLGSFGFTARYSVHVSEVVLTTHAPTSAICAESKNPNLSEAWRSLELIRQGYLDTFGECAARCMAKVRMVFFENHNTVHFAAGTKDSSSIHL